MTAKLLDGHAHARIVIDKIASELDRLPRAPGLAVVLVGCDPASQIYVQSKVRMAERLGLRGAVERLPDDCSEANLLARIDALNARHDIDGILIQLPLPAHIDSLRVMAAVDPAKDVDGLHALNAGRLFHGDAALVPCTPLGCLRLIKSIRSDLTGAHAVVIGSSNIVGKPMAALLLQEQATVTQTHIHTRGISQICRQADILVSAVGKAGLVGGDWIKPQAIVIVSAPRGSRSRTAATRCAATSLSTKRCRSPARSRRCRAASAR
ncbi:methylenetetrahydrofolate dehydrogenase (NADP+)/methenyltetrahydrofolate cyclohydrolase [Bradyrhizobium sp. USDA 4454]